MYASISTSILFQLLTSILKTSNQSIKQPEKENIQIKKITLPLEKVFWSHDNKTQAFIQFYFDLLHRQYIFAQK